jgi:hypothetical protein
VADAPYEPGTVMVFGGDAEITTTDTQADKRIAGVVSTDPAFLMNSALDGENTVSLALMGRVPCKVIGQVQKGDILVASSTPGYAIVDNNAGAGTILGKSLEDKTNDGPDVIEVVVGIT